MRAGHWTVWILGAMALAPLRAQQPETPRDPSAALMAPALNITDAEDLLAELERADAGLLRLRADILHDKTFAIAGDRQVRVGTLWFESPPPTGEAPPRRRFAIEFTRLLVGDRLQDDPQVYIFDGEWLVEKHPRAAQMLKRQVVPPGQAFDPLRLGQGPLPIPIGQRREDILARFEATLVSPQDGLSIDEDAEADEKAAAENLRREVEGLFQLRLVPRRGSEAARDFREVRLWYQRGPDGRLLPRMARTVSLEGNVSLVKLINVEVNPPTPPPESVFDTRSPEGWDVHVTPWREPGG